MYISVHIGMCTRIYVFIFHSCNLRALYASFLNGGEQSSARRGAASASVQCHHNKPTRQGQTGSSLRRAAGRPVLYFGVPFFGYKTGIKRRFSFFRRSHARHLFLLPGFTICFLFFSVFFLVRSSFLLEVRSRPRSQWPKGTYVVSYEVIHYQVRLYTTTIHTMLRNDDVLKYVHIRGTWCTAENRLVRIYV